MKVFWFKVQILICLAIYIAAINSCERDKSTVAGPDGERHYFVYGQATAEGVTLLYCADRVAVDVTQADTVVVRLWRLAASDSCQHALKIIRVR